MSEASPPEPRGACPALRRQRISRILDAMNWTKPAFEELKMDAEIGSYQEDGQEDREWTPIVQSAADSSDAG
jgi:hypothetical protein